MLAFTCVTYENAMRLLLLDEIASIVVDVLVLEVVIGILE